MINEVLRQAAREESASYLWLADRYDTLPDYDPDNPGAEGTLGLLDSNWRSPFVDSGIMEVATFVRAAPKPPKPLSKLFFVVLRKELFEQSKQVLIYKILDVEGDNDGKIELQSVPWPAHLVGYFFTSRSRILPYWDQAFKDQAMFYGAGADWPDDCGMDIDLIALIVLDEFPIEVRNRASRRKCVTHGD